MAIWVTRTEPGASRLATALQQANLDVQKSPALSIVDIEQRVVSVHSTARADKEEQKEAAPDVCIVLSPHAASRYINSSWYCAEALHVAIGQATQSALGIPASLPVEATSEGILDMAFARESGYTVWIISGVGGRKALADGLKARGMIVRKLELYERVAAPMAEFAPVAGDLIEVGSMAALENVAGRLATQRLDTAHEQKWEQPSDLAFLVPSQRIAAAAKERKFYNTHIACSAEITDVVAAAITYFDRDEEG